MREQAPTKPVDEEAEIDNAIILNEEDDCEVSLSDEDDDESYEYDDNIGNELYDSKLDQIDEVIRLRDAINHI